MNAMRDAGYTCGVVEKWNMHARIRQDLYGFIDLIAMGRGGIIGVQATTMAHKADHLDKIIAEPRAITWLRAGGRIQLWSWRKLKVKVNRKSWQADIQEVTLKDFPAQSCEMGASYRDEAGDITLTKVEGGAE